MINLDKCRYNISSDTERSLKMLIENSLRWYLNKDNITFDDVQFLTTIMEIFPLLNNKEYWESIGYDICKGIKGRLENENRIMFDDVQFLTTIMEIFPLFNNGKYAIIVV